MRHIVIGTAGHIDHGKSTLVQALTGIDPDRLKEEKARGITIDLGFAHADLGEDLRVAFVDVPGHERFVRNMLAGATGIDAVLLVVAADESVMPQTREHFSICRLLDVRRGCIVLTKCDLADADMIAVARDEVRELAAGSFLADAPVIEVSARTGDGLDALRAALRELACQAPARDGAGSARLPIDRAFSMKGFGAVVTGTLASGGLRVEDEMLLLPAARRVRVRGLQVHSARVQQAASGQRVAVNLGDVDAAEVVRGETLATPGTLEPTLRADTRVRLLDSARPLRHGARVRFHQGTREVMGRIALSHAWPADAAHEEAGTLTGTADAGDGVPAAQIASTDPNAPAEQRVRTAQAASTPHVAPATSVAQADQGAPTESIGQHGGRHGAGRSELLIPPGGHAYARLRFEAPVVITRGDRFVLRAYSPVTTIGGGMVLDPQPPRGALRTTAARQRFALLDPDASSAQRLDDGPAHALRPPIPSNAPRSPNPLHSPHQPDTSAASQSAGRAVMLMIDEAGREGLVVDALVSRAGLAPADAEALAVWMVEQGRAIRVTDRLIATGLVSRLAAELLEQVTRHHQAQPESDGVPREEARERIGVSPRLFERLVEQAVADNRLTGRERLALPGHRAAVPEAETMALPQIEQLLRDAGLKPPDSAELSARCGISLATVERLQALLVRQKRLMKVGTLVFHQEALERLKAETRALKAAASGEARVTVDVASFKARYDVSRKFAIPLLEYLDRERVTRRVGDARVVL